VDHDKSVLGLASIRRNRGLSLEKISQNTKISTRSLQAIEEGDFKKLPGGIYNTSYIRQYARAIEFDESELALVPVLRAMRQVHYAGWIAQRWGDPAFPAAFPFAAEPRWWEQHIADLGEIADDLS